MGEDKPLSVNSQAGLAKIRLGGKDCGVRGVQRKRGRGVLINFSFTIMFSNLLLSKLVSLSLYLKENINSI